MQKRNQCKREIIRNSLSEGKYCIEKSTVHILSISAKSCIVSTFSRGSSLLYWHFWQITDWFLATFMIYLTLTNKNKFTDNEKSTLICSSKFTNDHLASQGTLSQIESHRTSILTWKAYFFPPDFSLGTWSSDAPCRSKDDSGFPDGWEDF